MKDVLIYPGYSSTEIDELKELLAGDGVEFHYTDSGMKGGPGDPTVSEVVQEVAKVGVRFFKGFTVEEFLRDWVLQASVAGIFRKVLGWRKKNEKPGAVITLDIDFHDDFAVHIVMDGDPDESFNEKLNQMVRSEYQNKIEKGLQGHTQLFLRWDQESGSIEKLREYLTERV